MFEFFPVSFHARSRELAWWKLTAQLFGVWVVFSLTEPCLHNFLGSLYKVRAASAQLWGNFLLSPSPFLLSCSEVQCWMEIMNGYFSLSLFFFLLTSRYLLRAYYVAGAVVCAGDMTSIGQI